MFLIDLFLVATQYASKDQREHQRRQSAEMARRQAEDLRIRQRIAEKKLAELRRRNGH